MKYRVRVNEIDEIDGKPFQFYGEDAGTVENCKKGYYSSTEWKKEHPRTNRRSPFSNFFFTRGETYDIPGIGNFTTTEAIIMLWKASVMGDGAIARCFKDHGDSLVGTASKSLGRWVTPFEPTKWCPKVVAMYVTLIKWDQCPVFQAEMRRIPTQTVSLPSTSAHLTTAFGGRAQLSESHWGAARTFSERRRRRF